MTNFPNFPRNLIPWIALGGSGLAIFLSIPKAAENFKPIDNNRMENVFEILTDKKTGAIYGWIEGKDGEKPEYGENILSLPIGGSTGMGFEETKIVIDSTEDLYKFLQSIHDK